MQIIVRENNLDQALRALKKKLQREGLYREMKLRQHYEKPSERRAGGCQPRPQGRTQAR
jgi:small subunit ribosomal protein S21